MYAIITQRIQNTLMTKSPVKRRLNVTVWSGGFCLISHWLKVVMWWPDRTWGYSASRGLNQMPYCLAQGKLEEGFLFLPQRGLASWCRVCVLGFHLATNKRSETKYTCTCIYCLSFKKQGPVRCSTWQLKSKFGDIVFFKWSANSIKSSQLRTTTDTVQLIILYHKPPLQNY